MSRNKGRYTLRLHGVLHLRQEFLDRLVVKNECLRASLIASYIHHLA